MKIDYIREMNRNYLRAELEAGASAEYTAKMLEGNKIKGLLPMRISYRDGIPVFCYDITSKQPLGRLLGARPVTEAELRSFLGQLSAAVEAMRGYLLGDEGFLLEPDFIYADPESFQLGFCLVPGEKRDFLEQLRRLLQYFLKHVDHRDRECVVLAYGLYQESLQENCGMERLMQLAASGSEGEGVRRRDAAQRTSREASSERRQEEIQERSMGKEEVQERVRQDERMQKRSTTGNEAVRRNTAGRNTPGRMTQGGERTGERLQGFLSLENIPQGRKLKEWIVLVIAMEAAFFLLIFVAIPIFVQLIFGWYVFIRLRIFLTAGGLALFLCVIAADAIIGWHIWNKMSTGGSVLNQPASKRENWNRPEINPWQDVYEEEELEYRTPARAAPQRAVAEERQPVTPADLDRRSVQGDGELFQTILLNGSGGEKEKTHRLTAMPPETEDIVISYFPFVIGKSRELVDYVLDRETVSRFHIRLEQEEGIVRLTDLNSTNGTRVRGRLLAANETVELQKGDEVVLADRPFLWQ